VLIAAAADERKEGGQKVGEKSIYVFLVIVAISLFC